MSEVAALKESVKKIVKSLLVASPEGMDERMINREYMDLEGKRLPCGRLGFSCAEDLLKSFDDILEFQRHNNRIIYTCKKSDEDQHVWRMVREQKNLPNKTINTVKYASPGKQGTFVPAEIQNNIMNILIEYGNWIELSSFCKLYKQRLGSLPSIQNLAFESMEVLLQTMSGRVCTKYDSKGVCYISAAENMTNNKLDLKDSYAMENYSTRSLEQDCNVSVKHIPNAVIDAMKIIAQEKKDGIRVELLIPLYKDLTGKDLNIYSMGYSSVLELVHALGSIFKINTTKNNDYYVTPVSVAGPKKDLSQKAKSRLKSLLKIKSCGISPQQLFALYKKEFPGTEEELDWIAHGYNSFFDLLQTQSDSILRIQLTTNGPLVFPLPIINGTKPGLPNMNSSKTPPSNNRNYNLINSSVNKNKKFVLAGESFKKVNLKEAIEDDGWFEILVAEVYSPLFFWAQLRNNDKKLNKLMDQMMEFYNQPQILEKYHINSKELVLEMPVVSFYEEDKNFYRATITNFKGFDTVEVFYVDYGTDAQVNRKKLWYLDRQFFDFPTQAFQARLSGVAPSLPGQRWVHGASKRFLQLVETKPLCAKIVGKKGSAFDLYLVDTTHEEHDVYINDRLILEQFAVSQEESNKLDVAGASAREFGNEDADLSLALHLSREEHNQRNLIEERQKQLNNGMIPIGGKISTTADKEVTLTLEEVILQKALAMSIEDSASSKTVLDEKLQASAISGYPLNLEKMSEEDQMNYAMKMSMQKEPLAVVNDDKPAVDSNKEICRKKEEQYLSKTRKDDKFTIEELVQIRDSAGSNAYPTSTPIKEKEILLKEPELLVNGNENSECLEAPSENVDTLNTITEYIGQLKKKRNNVIMMLCQDPSSDVMLNQVKEINETIKELKRYKENLQVKINQ